MQDEHLNNRDGNVGIAQFHLAIAVHDLELARRFYRDVLGATEGRSTANHIDFNFYGHHLVVHIAPPDNEAVFASFDSDFHGEAVKVPHFGINFDRATWSELAARIKAHNYEFYDPPHIRMAGMPGEHATLFVLDPSGNALEFKAFRNHDEVFARVFDPKTKELFPLGEMTASAAQPNSAGA